MSQGLQFTFEASGDRLIHRELLRFGRRALDARPAFSAIADDLMGYEERRFATDGDGTWRPLAPSTVLSKARKHLDPRIERATGALHRSLTIRHDPGQELVVAPDFLLFGSHVESKDGAPYGEYQQRGTTRIVVARAGDTIASLHGDGVLHEHDRALLASRNTRGLHEPLQGGEGVHIIRMPARKPLGFTETQKVRVLKRLQGFIVTGTP